MYRGICTSDGNSKVHKDLDCFFEPFANAYIKICQEQTNANHEFFGLRDFYRYLICAMINVHFKMYKCT